MTVVDAFNYVDGCLHAEGASCAAIAREFGTPTFVYSRAAIESRYLQLERALEGVRHRICYAVKANSNLAVLNVLARLGAGFDIVSAGELERVIAAGGEPSKVVFSGVGKRAETALGIGDRYRSGNLGKLGADDLGPMGQQPRYRKAARLADLPDLALQQARSHLETAVTTAAAVFTGLLG